MLLVRRINNFQDISKNIFPIAANIDKSYDKKYSTLPKNQRNACACSNNKFSVKYSLCNFNGLILKRTFSIQPVIEWQQNLYTGISNSTLVVSCQDACLTIHDISGLPWWATIVVSTLLLRTLVTFPLTIYCQNILAKYENISYEYKEIVEDLNRETALAKKRFNLSEKQLRGMYIKSMRTQWKKLIIRDNCHPLKASVVLWFQIPLWVSASFALRNLINMQPTCDARALITLTELTVGGFGWIPNLTEVDHSFILPVFLGLTNLAIIELHAVSKLQKPSRFRTIVTNVLRGLSLAMALISAYVPSALTLYWTTSSAAALVQHLVIISPRLRRKCGIPETPSELENPYTHIKVQIGDKLNNIGSVFKKSAT